MGKLHQAFRQGLALPPSFDLESAEIATVSQWDSVAHLQLVVALEDAYGIRLTPADVIELTSFRKAIDILHRHGVGPDA